MSTWNDGGRPAQARCWVAAAARLPPELSPATAGLVSAAPWCRRLTTPSAWKVCATGIGPPPVRACTCATASSAACPDIQKCACTTSGRSTNHSAASTAANVPMYGKSSSFGTARAGPASTWTSSTPGRSSTRTGSSAESRRVYTVTWWPRSASAADNSATWTFCPPASTPPRVASGLACSETIATFIGHSLPARPLPRRSVARSARPGGGR